MKLFSSRGMPSTKFEKGLLFSVLLSGVIFAASQYVEIIERHNVFLSAKSETLGTCYKQTDFAIIWFFTERRQQFYNCIVLSEDKQFREAAAKYVLKNASYVAGGDN